MAERTAGAAFRALAIGGSWGGLEVVTRILQALPGSLPVPVFLVLHQRPALDSGLVEILARRSALEAVSPRDKTEIEPGRLYVAPPDYHMLINPEGTVGLALYRHVHYSRPSIDETFFSVGHIYGSGALAVIMTGANEDGASGIGYIARRGGLTVAQSPSEAEAPTMPESAIATGCVREVLGTEAIGGYLRDSIIRVRP